MSYNEEDMYSSKNHFVTGILCFLFGYFGTHRFYVGKWKSGLLILLFTCSFLFVMFKINFFIGCCFLGLDLLYVCSDFFQIYYNIFTDKSGKIISTEGGSAGDKKDKIHLVISFCILGTFFSFLGIARNDTAQMLLGSLFIIVELILAAVENNYINSLNEDN